MPAAKKNPPGYLDARPNARRIETPWRLASLYALMFLLAFFPVCTRATGLDRNPEVPNSRFTKRVASSQPAGAVFDLLFLAVYGEDMAADIASPIPLATSIARKCKRDDLVALCTKAQSGSIALAIPHSSKDLRDFQDLCRLYESVRDWRRLPSSQVLERLQKCEEGFNGLGAEVASAAASARSGRLNMARLSRFRAAEAKYEAALGVFGRYEMNLALAVVYEELASTYLEQGMFDVGKAALLEAADLFVSGGKPSRAADCCLQVANHLADDGENRLATAQVAEALNLAKRHYALGGKPEALLSSLDRAAGVMEHLGDSDRLLCLRREASDLSRKAGDTGLRISALRAYASALDNAGKAKEADRLRSDADGILNSLISKLKASIKLLSSSKEPNCAQLAESYSQLGWAYQQRNVVRDAVSSYAIAAQFYESAGDCRNALTSLTSQRGCQEEGFPIDLIADKAEQWSQWDIACAELTELALTQGSEPLKAGEYYKRAISAARKSDPRWLLSTLSAYGRFLLQNDDRPRAEKYLIEAIEVACETWCSLDESTGLYLSAVKASDSRERVLALMEDWAKRALSASQHELSMPSGKSEPSETVVEAMSKLLSAEIEAGRKAQASDLAARFSASPALKPAYLVSIGQSDELRKQIGPVSELSTAIRVATGRAEVVKWLTATLSVSGHDAPDPGRIVRQVDSLPKDTAYVQYLVTHTGVYALTSTDLSITCLGSGSALDEVMTEFRLAVLLAQADVSSGLMMKSPGSPPTTEPDSMMRSLIRLHELLLRPILPSLTGKASLVIGLPRDMRCLPVHALISADTGRHLIQDSAVSYTGSGDVASASEISKPWNGSEKVTVLAADHSVAPAVEDEITGIHAAFPSSRCIRGHEIGVSFEEALIEARCVHISAHCSSGRNGTVEFGEAKAPCSVSIDDIYGIRASDLELVVLSCCESAGGVETHIGTDASLVSAFEFAGARSIVASLWRVSDKASAVFAGHFYTALASGESKAEALQLAQLAIASTPGLQHPFYWAAFALFGDPI